jgi:hypothetical protein
MCPRRAFPEAVKLWGKFRRANPDPDSDAVAISAVANARVPPTAESATSGERPPPSDVPGPWRIVKAAASFITPVTLITGLMYYFGLLHAYWFFGRFGVDYTVFELTPEDYILRSADGLFLPFSIAAMGVLILAAVYQVVAPRLRPQFVERLIPTGATLFLALGLGLTIVACVAFLRPLWLVNFPSFGGLALAFGVLLLKGGTGAARELEHRRRPPTRPVPPYWRVAEWTAVIMLVSVGLFWAVGDFSAKVGSQRADEVVRALPTLPGVVVDSEQRLYLDYNGVNETVCEADDGTRTYRYDGLTLITQEGGQLLLLPRLWTAAAGSATVLSKTDSLVLQFDTGVPSTPIC